MLLNYFLKCFFFHSIINISKKSLQKLTLRTQNGLIPNASFLHWGSGWSRKSKQNIYIYLEIISARACKKIFWIIFFTGFPNCERVQTNSHEGSGMGRLNLFRVKGKKPQMDFNPLHGLRIYKYFGFKMLLVSKQKYRIPDLCLYHSCFYMNPHLEQQHHSYNNVFHSFFYCNGKTHYVTVRNQRYKSIDTWSFTFRGCWRFVYKLRSYENGNERVK